MRFHAPLAPCEQQPDLRNNRPASRPLSSPNPPLLSVRVDDRLPLLTLKQEMAVALGLALGEFKLRRSENDQEIKDLKKPVSSLRLESGAVLFVQRGPPADELDCLFRVFTVANKRGVGSDSQHQQAPPGPAPQQVE